MFIGFVSHIELVYCQPNHLDLSDGFLDHVFFGSLLAAARVLVHLDGAEKGEAKDSRWGRVHARVRPIAAPLRQPANLLEPYQSRSHIPIRLCIVRFTVNIFVEDENFQFIDFGWFCF